MEEVCLKCNGTGWYQYDHNHSTVCNKCCKHDQGFWYLTHHYGDKGKWCCSAGCGFTVTYKEAIKRMLELSGNCPFYMGLTK